MRDLSDKTNIVIVGESFDMADARTLAAELGLMLLDVRALVDYDYAESGLTERGKYRAVAHRVSDFECSMMLFPEYMITAQSLRELRRNATVILVDGSNISDSAKNLADALASPKMPLSAAVRTALMNLFA